jgi:glycosyltransferase involved in cell wall biosynthesis
MKRKNKVTSKKFTMLSAASGYRRDYRELTPILLGLKIFFKKFPDAKEKFTICFIGDEPSGEYQEMMAELGISELVEYSGPVGREELVKRLWNADLFFEILLRGIPTAVSGTLYEYWAAGKAPILLVSEEGEASKILKDNQLGAHALLDEVNFIADYIEKVYLAYSSGSPMWITREGVEKYSRKQLTAQMVKLWNQSVEV